MVLVTEMSALVPSSRPSENTPVVAEVGGLVGDAVAEHLMRGGDLGNRQRMVAGHSAVLDRHRQRRTGADVTGRTDGGGARREGAAGQRIDDRIAERLGVVGQRAEQILQFAIGRDLGFVGGDLGFDAGGPRGLGRDRDFDQRIPIDAGRVRGVRSW